MTLLNQIVLLGSGLQVWCTLKTKLNKPNSSMFKKKEEEAKQPCIIEWLKQNSTALRPDWEGVTQSF